MKAKIYLLFASLCLILATACEDELELFPEDTKIPEFNRIEDFNQALIGAYNSFQGGGAYAKNLITLDAWVGDDMRITPRNLGDGAFLHQWNYASDDSDMSASWARLYTTIRRANNIIVNSGNLDDPAVDQITGEALGIRALCHLELYKLFGQRYGDGNSMGVVFTNTLDIERKPERLTSEEILAMIEMDIAESRSLISPDFNPERINIHFLEGLEARVAMHRENWSDVIIHTTNVIDNGPAIATLAQYPNIWNGLEANNEILFKVVFLPGDATIGDVFWNVDVQQSFFAPSRDIIDLLKENGGKDVRYSTFINEDQERVTKYIGASGNANLADVKVMRTSEMYLLRAEAHAALGNNAQAQSDLDVVRVNRIPGYTSTVEPNMMNAVQAERRKELCYEGFRVFDLKRWNLPIDRGNDCIEDRCTLPANDFRMIYPIPQNEVFANDNMIQNPGY